MRGFTTCVIDTSHDFRCVFIADKPFFFFWAEGLLSRWESPAWTDSPCVTQPHIPCVSSRGAVPLFSFMGKCSSGFKPSSQRFLSFMHKSQRKHPGLFETTIAPSDARWQWEMSSSWLKHSNYFSHLTFVFIQTYCPGLCWHGLKSHFLLKFSFSMEDIAVGRRDGNSGPRVPFCVPTAFFHILHMKRWPEGSLTSTTGASGTAHEL